MPSECQMNGYNKEADEQPNQFQNLVQELRTLLGPSSGIDSDDNRPASLQALMKGYSSDSSEWIKYAFQDNSRNYTRNLVDEGNGKCNLLILVWTPKRESQIHDHADSHCIMKILKGSLQETLFEWPDSGEQSPLTLKKSTTICENEVTYMSDQLGLHRISNKEDEVAVSLHLYTPPNAAIHGCHVYDEKTGKSSHVTLCNFFSVIGKRDESTSL